MQTLEQRIRDSGPLEVVEAVRLVARAAGTLDRLHQAGVVHGRIGWAALRYAGEEPELLDPGDLVDAMAFHSPERIAGGGPSARDDVWALGVLLYAALTEQVPFDADGPEAIAARIESVRPPPLAVFDAGDDELDALLSDALARDEELRPPSASDFRRELLAWLERHDQRGGEALPLSAALAARLTGGARAPDAGRPASPAGLRAVTTTVDVASLPPPPPGPDAPPPAPKPSAFTTILDEETTVPRDDRPTLPHADPAVAATTARAMADRVGPPVVRAPKLPSGRPPPMGRSVPPPPAAPLDAPLDAPPASTGRRSAPPSGDAELRPSLTPAPPKTRASLLARATAPSLPGEPPEPRGPISLRAFGITLGAFTAVLALWFGFRALRGDAGAPSAGASSAPIASPTSAASAPPSSTASASAPPSAAPTSVPVASAEAAPPASAPIAAAPPEVKDVGACLVSLFPAGSFPKKVGRALDFVCTERAPRTGAPKVKEALVRASDGRVTDGMREWALLGWYENAAYAALRGRCCPSAPPLELPVTPGSCPDFGEALRAISEGARPGTTDERAAALTARFDESLRCVLRSRQTKAFGKHRSLAGGEGTAFEKTFARTRAATP